MARTKFQPLMIENPFPLPVRLPAPYGKVERWIWTQSSMKQFRRCKRKFFWKYIVGIRPRTTTASLWIGTVFHKTIARWFAQRRANIASLARKEVDAMSKELEANLEFFDQEELDKLQASMAMFTGMCMGYAEQYAKDRTRWAIKRPWIEKEFRIELDDFDFCGSIDQIVSDKEDGKRILVERKTSSKITDSYIDRLALDTQTRAYLWAAEKIGLKCARVIYDVTRKSNLRRKSNEDQDDYEARVANDYFKRPEFNFFREELRFGKQDLNAFEHELHQTHAEFMHVIKTADDPADPRSWNIDDQECNAFFRICEFQRLCLRGLDRGSSAFFQQPPSPYVELEQDTTE